MRAEKLPVSILTTIGLFATELAPTWNLHLGGLPIYVAHDSADVWSHTEILVLALSANRCKDRLIPLRMPLILLRMMVFALFADLLPGSPFAKLVLSTDSQNALCHYRNRFLLLMMTPRVASLLEVTLSGGEWCIESETSRDRALLRVAAKRYGVVLAAMEGPGTGGPDFVRRVRRIRPEAKVIVTAATVTPTEIIESLKAHAFAHFSKPT